MINESSPETQGKIFRVARAFGNGAHVLIPKEWIGEQIALVKAQKKGIKERIFSALSEYLDSIVGIYLYGSYARSEQAEDSDIDLFIIADKKIKIRAEGFEIISLEKKDIEKAIKAEPLLIYSILSEAKPIMNSGLLDELRKNHMPKKPDFKSFFKDTWQIIKVNEEFLESEKGDYLSSEAIIYSLVLRLRGLFIIKSILKKSKYTHKSFRSWIKSELPKINFSQIYGAYRSSKNEEKIKQKIKVKDIISLLDFLKNHLSIMENG